MFPSPGVGVNLPAMALHRRPHWGLVFLFVVGCGHAPATRIQTAPGTSGRAFAGEPYERHHRWKDWRVTVLERPQNPASLTWYQVQVSRSQSDGEVPLYMNTFDSEGVLERTWLEDVRGNGWPTLVVFTRSRGTGAYGSLRLLECGPKGFRARPAPRASARQLAGYRGHDEWRWEDDSLFRVFPIYRLNDPDDAPGGGQRTLRYNWKKGKWRFRFKNEDAPPPSQSTTPLAGAVDPARVP